VVATGDVRWSLVRATPMLDAAGQVESVISSFREVTREVVFRQRLETEHAVTKILAESERSAEALVQVVQALCETLEYRFGAVWSLAPGGDSLECRATWSHPLASIAEFDAASLRRSFRQWEGLPGRVWGTLQPEWIADAASEPAFLRSAVASQSGLHAALAFPLLSSGTFVGVIELLAGEVRAIDPDLLEVTAIIGNQIGQFIERTRIRDELIALGTIVESSTEAILSKTLDGVITSWNRGAEQLYGYTAEEAMGKPVSFLVPTDRPNEIPSILARLARGRDVPPFETVRVRKDGSHIDVLLNLSPVLDTAGEVVGASAIAVDITERKRNERALRFLAEASRELGASLDYEATLAAVARLAVPEIADWCTVDMLDANGKVRRLATAHADPAKIALAAELARRYPELDPPRAIRTGESELYTDIADPLAQTVTDPELLAAISNLGLKSAMVVPMLARSRVIGAISFVTAESGRRYDQTDVAFAQELADRAAAAVDNARLYTETSRALATRDEFLASVSHDLRNPLAAIKGAAQALALPIQRGQTPDPQRLREGLSLIDATVTGMADMVDGLLDAMLVQMGRPLDLRRSLCDLAALTRQAAAEVWQLGDRHSIQIDSPQSLMGNWDAVRMRRMAGNLIDNAVKYSPEDTEVLVTLAHEGREGDWAVLTVKDNGIGIPAEDLPYVFERFHRGSNVVGTVAGTGIGLVTVKQVVEQHGGTISMDSEEGVGTTVIVRLPLDETASGGGGTGPGRSAAPEPPRRTAARREDGPISLAGGR
ncbi:MAG TPA: ATP-binding protein, partial [Chloroflexota bacterium]